MDAKFNRLVAVREDHSGEGEPVNSVCSVGECASPRPATPSSGVYSALCTQRQRQHQEWGAGQHMLALACVK